MRAGPGPDHDQAQRRLRSDQFHALLGAVRVLGAVNDIQVVEVTSWTDDEALDDLMDTNL